MKFHFFSTGILLLGLFAHPSHLCAQQNTKQNTPKQNNSDQNSTIQILPNQNTPKQDTSNQNTASLIQELSSNFRGQYFIDNSQQETVGSYKVPRLFNGIVLNQTPILQKFTSKTGAAATIFLKQDSDFIRIATTLKKEDGTYALGTVLDRSSPAYQSLSAGKNYVGDATLFGKRYMAQYDLIRDVNGSPIGALFVGIPQ